VQDRQTYLVCRLVLLGLLAALTQTAGAADAKGQYGVRGAALVPCSIYERERATESELYRMIASWMDGYITAISQHVPDTYDAASFESTELITALVSESCKKNPQTSVFVVVNSLMELIAVNRLQKKSQKIDIAIGEYNVLLYKEVVRRIKEKLLEAGYYNGEVNEMFDADAEKAMQAYQESIEFEPTGFPDQLTLYRLFYDEPE